MSENTVQAKMVVIAENVKRTFGQFDAELDELHEYALSLIKNQTGDSKEGAENDL